jgi:UDP-perosamine 4-acetyltransferase
MTAAQFPITRDLALLGGGGHGRVLIATVELLGGWFVAVNDPKLAQGGGPAGVPVLGDDELIAQCPADRVVLVNGVGSTGPADTRAELFWRWRARGYRFATIVHPSAVVAKSAALGEGAQAMAGAVIQNDARIGTNCLINTRASVDHDCVLGDTVHLAPGVTLSGGVRVGDRSHLGTGACVIQGVAIGQRCMIGAGAVVVGDLADGSRVAPGAVAGERKEASP